MKPYRIVWSDILNYGWINILFIEILLVFRQDLIILFMLNNHRILLRKSSTAWFIVGDIVRIVTPMYETLIFFLFNLIWMRLLNLWLFRWPFLLELVLNKLIHGILLGGLVLLPLPLAALTSRGGCLTLSVILVIRFRTTSIRSLRLISNTLLWDLLNLF